MKLLLVPEQQVPPRKAPRALRALKWLFFRMRPFMALQMFQPREGSTTRSAYMWSWFISLGRWEIGHRVLWAIRLCGLCWRCVQCAMSVEFGGKTHMLLSSPLPFPVPPALLVLAGVIDGPIVESCEFSTFATMLFPWVAALDVGRAQRKP